MAPEAQPGLAIPGMGAEGMAMPPAEAMPADQPSMEQLIGAL